MLNRLGSQIRNQWAGFVALFLVLAGGTAYAVDTVGSEDIINNSVASADLKNNDIRGVDVRDDTTANGGLGRDDLAPGSVDESEIADPTLTEVAYPGPAGPPGTGETCPNWGQFCSNSPGPTPGFWSSYSYEGSWEIAYFWKDPVGIVHIQGSVRGSQFAGPTIFYLPPGYRPSTIRLFGVYDESVPGKFGYVKVLPNGRVILGDNRSGGTPYLQLDGIDFRP